jgi:hypothetical protein
MGKQQHASLGKAQIGQRFFLNLGLDIEQGVAHPENVKRHKNSSNA